MAREGGGEGLGLRSSSRELGPASFAIRHFEDRIEMRFTVLAKAWSSLMIVAAAGFWYFAVTQTDRGGQIFLALWSTAAIAGLVASFRTRLTLSATGIEARCFRSRTLGWEQVAAIDVSRGTRARVSLGGGGVVRTVLL